MKNLKFHRALARGNDSKEDGGRGEGGREVIMMGRWTVPVVVVPVVVKSLLLSEFDIFGRFCSLTA